MVAADDKARRFAQGLDQTQKASAGISTALKNLAVTIAATFTVRAVVDFARETIKAASDMNETLSKSKVVFGDMADAVENMGDTAAKAMGLSKQEAIGAAATYGNLFTSMGLTKKASAEMSMNLVQLASDFASFNNILYFLLCHFIFFQ